MMRKVKARLPIININLDEYNFFQKFNAFCKGYGIYLISCSVEQNKYFCDYPRDFLQAFNASEFYYAPPMDVRRGILKIEYRNVYKENREITIRNGDIICFTGIDISIISPEYINENEKILSNE